MRTLSYSQFLPARPELDLSVPVGVVELHAEDRRDISVTLAPVDPADQVAADLIERATTEVIGTVYTVAVPEPAGVNGTTIINNGRTGATVVQNLGLVTGTVTGLVVNGCGDVTFNGSVNGLVNGAVVNGVTFTSGARGAVRATVRVPTGAQVELATVSASTRVSGPLDSLVHESISGDLRGTGTLRYLDARTVSGDVTIPAVDHASVASTSGDVRATLTGSTAEVVTVSGDITVHATRDARVRARSTSGDITVTHAPDVRVRTTARSVSGNVRTGD